jgi:hypothetical protein
MIVAIIGILINSYNQICLIADHLNIFWMFMLFNVSLIASGFSVKYQFKYFFVSHVISLVLHTCFYFYCGYNKVAREFVVVFPATFIYLMLLALTLVFLTSILRLKKIKINIGNSIDCFLPANEANCQKTLILLHAYSMIIHSTFISFLRDSSSDAIWQYMTIGLVIVLQLLIIAACLRIMDRYPSSASVPFYVSAHVMIATLLADQVYKNYKMYKDNKSFNLQSEYFSNKFIYLFFYLFVICALNGGVAYASDEEIASATVSFSGASTARYLRTGGTFAGAAVGYEGVSMVREAWENLRDSFNLEQGAVLSNKIEECVAAKNTLNTIDYKLRSEYKLIQEADSYLKMVQEEVANADVEDLRNYMGKIEQYTANLQAEYDTYQQYKSHVTDKLYRWFCGVKSCSKLKEAAL